MTKLARLPLAPLLALSDALDAPHAELAVLFAVHPRTILRWHAEGLTVRSAEDACDRIGIHPCGVWGDDWIQAALASSVRVVTRERPTHCRECEKRLPIVVKCGTPREFCGRRCQARASNRRKAERAKTAIPIGAPHE